jgi:hypothetical protein
MQLRLADIKKLNSSWYVPEAMHQKDAIIIFSSFKHSYNHTPINIFKQNVIIKHTNSILSIKLN